MSKEQLADEYRAASEWIRDAMTEGRISLDIYNTVADALIKLYQDRIQAIDASTPEQ